MQLRQGDVFLEQVSEMPKLRQPVSRDNGRVVLAYGEIDLNAN